MLTLHDKLAAVAKDNQRLDAAHVEFHDTNARCEVGLLSPEEIRSKLRLEAAARFLRTVIEREKAVPPDKTNNRAAIRRSAPHQSTLFLEK